MDEIQKEEKTRAWVATVCYSGWFQWRWGRIGHYEGEQDTEGGEDESLRVATVCHSGWSPCT